MEVVSAQDALQAWSRYIVRQLQADGTEKHLCGFIFRLSTYKLMRSKQINLINFYIKL